MQCPAETMIFCSGQPAGDFQARVVFRRERHDAHESLGGVEQSLHRVQVGGPDRFPRMGAGVARFRVQERPFHVDAADYVGRQRVLPADGRDPCQPRRHAIQIVGDDRRQDMADAVGTQLLASRMAGVDRRGRRR